MNDARTVRTRSLSPSPSTKTMVGRGNGRGAAGVKEVLDPEPDAGVDTSFFLDNDGEDESLVPLPPPPPLLRRRERAAAATDFVEFCILEAVAEE